MALRTRKITVGLAAGLLGVFLLAPATPAAAGGKGGSGLIVPPSDCTTILINNYSASLTCTNRPASQQWQSYRICEGPWLDTDAYGNIVTGNGTSTVSCAPYVWAWPVPGVAFHAVN